MPLNDDDVAYDDDDAADADDDDGDKYGFVEVSMNKIISYNN